MNGLFIDPLYRSGPIHMKAIKKAALVTGGSRRIGRELCLALAARGYDIALHYGQSLADAEETADRIRKRGVLCRLFQCNLSDAGKVQSLIRDVFGEFPYCTLLVNNASYFKRGSFQDTDLAFLERHLDVNFKAPYILSGEFAKLCKSGLIINLLDTKITRSSGAFFAYTLSKKMLAEFTRMAARVLGPGIRVNGICPGIILPSTETPAKVLEGLIRALPLARKGDPHHIVDALLYLIDNDYVTGDFLFVDGGEHLK
jgi:pteridine reductase